MFSTIQLVTSIVAVTYNFCTILWTVAIAYKIFDAHLLKNVIQCLHFVLEQTVTSAIHKQAATLISM